MKFGLGHGGVLNFFSDSLNTFMITSINVRNFLVHVKNIHIFVIKQWSVRQALGRY